MSSALTIQVGYLARRSMLRTLRQPAAIFFPLAFPVLLLAVNAGGLSPETKLPGFPTDSFLAFALAVPFIQGGLFATGNAGIDVAKDIQTGFLNRLALTPMRGSALILGELGGVMALCVVQALFYLIVGLAFGVRLASGVAGGFVILHGGRERHLPGLLRLPVHLVDERAAQPDGHGLVRVVGDHQPGLVPDRGDPQPDHHRLGLGGARARVRDRPRLGRGRLHAGSTHAPGADGTDVSILGSITVARAVAWRQLHNALTNPLYLLPSLAFPLLNFAAFAGGLSRIRQVPGFDFDGSYTAFQFVFVLLQSAAFSGVFAGFGIARDFETGFVRRLMLAAPNRSGLVLGWALASAGRWAVVAFVITAVAFITGMQVGGSGVDLFGLYLLALLINFAGTLWAVGVATRVRSAQAGPIMQMPVFLALFFAPVYVPLALLQGWIHAVASVNPVTPVMEAARGLVSGSPTETLLAYSTATALVLAFSLWAFRGLRRAENAGS
jgi:ABC-2 type transport system permease protein